MYRGSNKTAIASQQLIAEALLRLLEDSAYADVSISRICKEAGISRQTFYTLFGSKENVMIYELTNNCRYMPGESEESCKKESLRSFCRNLLSICCHFSKCLSSPYRWYSSSIGRDRQACPAVLS